MVGVIVLLGAGSYLLAGRFVFAGVTLLAGLGLTAFLVTLFLAMTGPDLRVDRDGIRGRMGWRRPVAATWSEVSVDTPADLAPRRFQLGVGPHTVTVYERSWSGFADFVLVLASSPGAVGAITPAARSELARLLQLEDDQPGPN